MKHKYLLLLVSVCVLVNYVANIMLTVETNDIHFRLKQCKMYMHQQTGECGNRLTVFTVETVVGGRTAAVVDTDHFVARPTVLTRSTLTL